jgi:hypothetical protein
MRSQQAEIKVKPAVIAANANGDGTSDVADPSMRVMRPIAVKATILANGDIDTGVWHTERNMAGPLARKPAMRHRAEQIVDAGRAALGNVSVVQNQQLKLNVNAAGISANSDADDAPSDASRSQRVMRPSTSKATSLGDKDTEVWHTQGNIFGPLTRVPAMMHDVEAGDGLPDNVEVPLATQVDIVARRSPPDGRFDASCVFFAHVPKTGGTTMRRVLTTLSHARSQKLEVCYNSIECDAPINEDLARRDPNIAADVLDDKCRNNQIVYGHMIIPEFAEYHAMPTTHAVWVAMIREPMAWAVSMYKEFYGTKRYEGSFEQWVQDGRHKNNMYNYFLDPHHITESIEKRAWDWLKSRRVLTLFTEDYVNCVRELARFLGATSAEESAMVHATSASHNVRPDEMYNVTLSQASFEVLRTDLEAFYTVYDIARKTSTTQTNIMRQPLVRPSEQHSNMMEVQVHLDWWDAEE